MEIAQPSLVSVIIPNYNHAAYLAKRIESVLTQTLPAAEVFILDDCSTDHSRAVLEKYAARDTRIKLLLNEQNSGSTFKQWAKGLSHITSKYVWIAESDDFAEPTFLAKLVATLEADETIAFSYANSTVVDENNQPHGTTADWKNEVFHTARWSQDFITDGRDELAQYLSQTCTVNNASAVVFRRSAIQEVGGVDTSFRYTGDWSLYIRLSLQGKVAYHAACLSNYREHSANASKKSLTDSSQLYERQKCFAFVYRSKALKAENQRALLQTASKEYMAILYNLTRRNWQPSKLLEYIRGIRAVDKYFFVQIQIRVASLMLRRAY